MTKNKITVEKFQASLQAAIAATGVEFEVTENSSWTKVQPKSHADDTRSARIYVPNSKNAVGELHLSCFTPPTEGPDARFWVPNPKLNGNVKYILNFELPEDEILEGLKRTIETLAKLPKAEPKAKPAPKAKATKPAEPAQVAESPEAKKARLEATKEALQQNREERKAAAGGKK